MNPRWDNSVGLVKDDPKNNMIIIRQSYNILLEQYKRQESSIANIDDLYRKFKLLKKYESEYMRNQELKKELSYWEMYKTEREGFLEKQIERLTEILNEAKQKMRQFKIEQERELNKINQLKRL